MASKTMRKIVKIDEAKCDGCGVCISSCMEGAIRIIDGKARLVGENLCDGLGNCLGQCPQDAISIEERPAEEFDEIAVAKHLHADAPTAKAQHAHAGGCPGSMFRMLGHKAPTTPPPASTKVETAAAAAAATSQLSQWPVQLALVPTGGPMWQDADVLISADCVPFACAQFHTELLAGKSLAIACPKLDDIQPYVEKLSAIFANNTIRSITIAHMEVPCCGGIVYAVRTALAQAGREDIPVTGVTVGIDGTIGR